MFVVASAFAFDIGVFKIVVDLVFVFDVDFVFDVVFDFVVVLVCLISMLISFGNHFGIICVPIFSS